jgi:hypothetical protein
MLVPRWRAALPIKDHSSIFGAVRTCSGADHQGHTKPGPQRAPPPKSVLLLRGAHTERFFNVFRWYRHPGSNGGPLASAGDPPALPGWQ